jgi:hypothetical protein
MTTLECMKQQMPSNKALCLLTRGESSLALHRPESGNLPSRMATAILFIAIQPQSPGGFHSMKIQLLARSIEHSPRLVTADLNHFEVTHAQRRSDTAVEYAAGSCTSLWYDQIFQMNERCNGSPHEDWVVHAGSGYDEDCINADDFRTIFRIMAILVELASNTIDAAFTAIRRCRVNECGDWEEA